MRIVVDINHPAHVHLFKNFIKTMTARGHKVIITASQKDLTFDLLNLYKFKFYNIGSYGKSIISKMRNLPQLDLNLYHIVKHDIPDVFLSVGSIRAAHVSAILRKKSISFDDTEIQDEQRLLYLPFTDAVLTPSCFLKNLGPKQVRYNGYHALAHLHPNWFTPDPSVLSEVNLEKGDPFFIVRLVSWGATHDFGKSGVINLGRVIHTLEKHGRVFLTSESPIKKYIQYNIMLRPDRFHSLLAYSQLYIGDGGTTATEAAVLGVPSIYVSPLIGKFGVYNELEKRYSLLFQYDNIDDALIKGVSILKNYNKSYWNDKKIKFIREKIDVTEFMVWFIENYPLSVERSRGIRIGKIRK